MICGTCGCDNPDKLIFCQECGQRLASSRVAQPTPPIVAAPPLPPSPQAPPAPRAATKPTVGTATAIAHASAGPRPPGEAVAFWAQRDEAREARTDEPLAAVGCSRCGAPNEPGARYCVSCGDAMSLAAGLSKSATVANSPPQPRIPSTPAPKPLGAATGGPIAPTPVVDIRAPEDERRTSSSQDGARICARCRGTCDAGTLFCKFGGAPFGDARPGSTFPRHALPPIRSSASAATATRRPGAEPASASPVPPPVTSPMASPAALPATSPVTFQARPTATPPIVPPHANPMAGPVRDAGSRAPRRRALPAPALDLQFGDVPAAATPLLPPSNEPSPYQGSAAPQPGKPAGRLVVITKDGGEGASYPIYEQLDIGRSEGDVLVHEDRYLSPRHARILRRLRASTGEPQLVLRDLQSANGSLPSDRQCICGGKRGRAGR